MLAVLGAVVLSAASGCSSSPASLGHSATDEWPLEVTTLFDESAALVRVSDVESLPGGALRAVTSTGAITLGATGAEIRRVVFSPARPWLFPVRRLLDGSLEYYAGYDDSADEIVFFDALGKEVVRQPCKWCRDLVVVRVSAASEALLVRANDGSKATLFSARGRERRDFGSPGYLTDVHVITVAGAPSHTLVLYFSPDADSAQAVRLVRLDGTEIARWPVRAGASVGASTAADGRPTIVSLDGDNLVTWDALTGKVLSSVAVEHASAFREVLVQRLSADRRVTVLSGGGSVDKHIVLVIDDTLGRVVFRRIVGRRAWGLAASRDGRSAFLVASLGRVQRYTPRL